MSSTIVRGGVALDGQAAARIETAGTDNSLTAPRVCKFPTYVRPCIISVPAGFTAAIRVKVNPGATAATAAANDFDNDSDDDGPGYFVVAAGATQELTFDSRFNVERVSFVTQDAGDDLDDVSLVGWDT